MSEPLWSDDKINWQVDLSAASAAEAYRTKTMVRRVRDDMQARIAELEARLAQTWQPLPDGEIPDSNLWIQDAYSDGWFLLFGINGASVWFPDNIRLCRLVERDEPQPTIPPDVRETLQEVLEWRRQWMKATGDQLTVNSIDEIDAALSWLKKQRET